MITPAYHGPGLKPTLRHLMILILFSAIMSALIAPMYREDQAPSARDKVVVAFGLGAATSLLLPALIMVLDRPGPTRTWYAVAVFWISMLALMGGAWWIVADSGLYPRPRFINGYLKWIVYLAIPLVAVRCVCRLAPAGCPSCGRRTLIYAGQSAWGPPLIRSCASCGARYRAGGWGPSSGPGAGGPGPSRRFG
jgi:hypothetical protein